MTYLNRELTSYAAVSSFVSTGLPGVRRILTVGESKLALLGPRAQTGRFKAFPPAMFVHDSRNLPDLARRMHGQGWDCIVYNRMSALFWSRFMVEDIPTERELALWASFWRSHTDLVFESPWGGQVQGYFYVFLLSDHAPKASRAVLPGIEGWICRMQTEMANGHYAEAKKMMAVLRRAAGDFGVVDQIEANLFMNTITTKHRGELLRRARSRGVCSPAVCLDIARYELVAGRPKNALELEAEAMRLDPWLTKVEAKRLLSLPLNQALLVP